MRGSSLASRQDFIVCPSCERYELKPAGQGSARCSSCGVLVSGAMLQTLKQITALADAAGDHACECGHPEMRKLPDGVFHCPACGSEVLPPGADYQIPDHGKAYWCGWLDGRFGKDGSFAHNPNLAKWEDPSSRLDYYKGHRKGREARRARERERSRA